MARIGLLGGTFDPPHLGHLVTGVNVRHTLGLDRVVFVVSGRPWQKIGVRSVTPAADRLALVEAAVDPVEGLEVSSAEIDRGGDSYTVDTLAHFRSEWPDDEFFVILGADAAAGLDTWERVDEVRSAATIVVVDRPGSPPPDDPDMVHVEVPRLDVSSTELRARVRDGRPLRFLVPDAVIDCIERRGLYRD